MAKQKKEEIADEVDLNENLEGEEGDPWFPYNATAFTVTKSVTGDFDLLLIRINTDTNEAQIERQPTRYSSVQRAIMDIQIRTEQELTKRGK